MASQPNEEVRKKEKKRSRPSEKEERPRKKKKSKQSHEGDETANGVSTETQSASSARAQSIRLLHVPKDENFTLVVASAPGIAIPSNTAFTAYTLGDELLLHSSDHPQLDYTAREHQDGGVEGQLKHYIGILDPDKKEMQIIEAKRVAVRSTLRAEDAEMRVAKHATQTSNVSARQALGAEFGTKKAKKAIASSSENAVKSTTTGDLTTAEGVKKAIQNNPSAKAMMESMAAGAANAPTKEENQAIVDAAKPRPKRNPDATTPEEVYSLDDLVGDDVMKLVKVKPWFDAIAQGKDVQTTSRFVSHRLKTLVDAEDVKRAKALRYLLSLIEVFNALQKGVKGNPGKKMPKTEDLVSVTQADPTVVQMIKRKFAPDGRFMSKWQVDFLTVHMAALALHIDGFETDMHDLRGDLSLKANDMTKYFKETGARIVNMTEVQREQHGFNKEEAALHRMAKLILPLEFPKERTPIPKTKNR